MQQDTILMTKKWDACEIWKALKLSIGASTLNETELNVVDLIVNILRKRREENQQPVLVTKTLSCEICCDILKEPTTLPCGHTFCKGCVRRRESSSFYELCFICDINFVKRRTRRKKLDNLHSDTALCTIIQDFLSKELEASKLREEGNQLFGAENYEDAEVKYMQSISLCANAFISWSNLSNLKAKLGCFTDALQAAKEAIASSPYWSKGYYREGVAYNGLQKFYDASLSFLKYLILDPSSQYVKDLLSQSLDMAISNKAQYQEDIHSQRRADMIPFEDMGTEVNNEHIKIDEVMIKLLADGLDFCSGIVTGKLEERISSMMVVLEQKMQTALKCPLCCGILFQPTTTLCGHTFCTTCLERSLDYGNTCSICRGSLEQLIIVRPKPINRIIQQLVQHFFQDKVREREADLRLEMDMITLEDDGVTVPIFVCSISMPTLETCLHVFEPRYKLMIRRCLESGVKRFGMCVYDELNGFCEWGTMLEIINNRTLTDGRLHISTIGGKRFKVLERGHKDGYCTAKVHWINDDGIENEKRAAIELSSKEVYEKCKAWVDGLPILIFYRVKMEFGTLPPYCGAEIGSPLGPKWLWWMIRFLMNGNDEKMKYMLTTTSIQERLNVVMSAL